MPIIRSTKQVSRCYTSFISLPYSLPTSTIKSTSSTSYRSKPRKKYKLIPLKLALPKFKSRSCAASPVGASYLIIKHWPSTIDFITVCYVHLPVISVIAPSWPRKVWLAIRMSSTEKVDRLASGLVIYVRRLSGDA